MPRSFLSPPIELLTAEGRFEALGEGGAPWRRPLVLLARELCSFERFESPGGARAPTLQAARLYARANSPFLSPGTLVRRAEAGYGIWWWDRERVGPWLARRFGAADVAAAPETLAQPPGAGWRIVRLASGFELQAWRGKALVASAWRRAPPDAADWSAFARQLRGAPEPPPATPPPAQTLPIAGDFGLGGVSGLELTPALAAGLAAGGAAVVLAGASAFWVGQGLRLSTLAGGLERQAEAERAAVAPRTDDTAAAQRLAAFNALADRPDPLAGLSTALEVLRAHGVAAKSFAVDGPVLTVTAPYAALGKVDAISVALAQTGDFQDVRPLPDSAAGVIKIELTMRGAEAGSPPGPD
jgi:hypothetical protein